MKVFIINQFAQHIIKETPVLPRVGDRVDLFCVPLPTVTSVILWPARERLDQLEVDITIDIDALITVE
jgi:hypothetical protein